MLVSGPGIVVYVFIGNQQMHKNDHFIVTLSHTLLHVSAYQPHHQGAHMILTNHLPISRPIRRTFLSEKCGINSNCVLYVEGKYLFPNL
jgi:hypothetical protein